MSSAPTARRPIALKLAQPPAGEQRPAAPAARTALLPPPPTLQQTPPLPPAPEPVPGTVGHAVIRAGPEFPPHACPACGSPIAVYGRLKPCSHALCADCAEGLKQCPTCAKEVTGVDRCEDTDGVFVCPFAGCSRAYLNSYSLSEHRRLRNHDPQTSSAPLPRQTVASGPTAPRGSVLPMPMQTQMQMQMPMSMPMPYAMAAMAGRGRGVPPQFMNPFAIPGYNPMYNPGRR